MIETPPDGETPDGDNVPPWAQSVVPSCTRDYPDNQCPMTAIEECQALLLRLLMWMHKVSSEREARLVAQLTDRIMAQRNALTGLPRQTVDSMLKYVNKTMITSRGTFFRLDMLSAHHTLLLATERPNPLIGHQYAASVTARLGHSTDIYHGFPTMADLLAGAGLVIDLPDRGNPARIQKNVFLRARFYGDRVNGAYDVRDGCFHWVVDYESNRITHRFFEEGCRSLPPGVTLPP